MTNQSTEHKEETNFLSWFPIIHDCQLDYITSVSPCLPVVNGIGALEPDTEGMLYRAAGETLHIQSPQGDPLFVVHVMKDDKFVMGFSITSWNWKWLLATTVFWQFGIMDDNKRLTIVQVDGAWPLEMARFAEEVGEWITSLFTEQYRRCVCGR